MAATGKITFDLLMRPRGMDIAPQVVGTLEVPVNFGPDGSPENLADAITGALRGA